MQINKALLALAMGVALAAATQEEANPKAEAQDAPDADCDEAPDEKEKAGE